MLWTLMVIYWVTKAVQQRRKRSDGVWSWNSILRTWSELSMLSSPLVWTLVSLYVGVPQASLSRLQLVQNAAWVDLRGGNTHTHIHTLLCWQPCTDRLANFKSILKSCYLFLKLYMDWHHNISLTSFTPILPHGPSRSSDQPLLSVPWSHLKTKPWPWNSLPIDIWSSLSFFSSFLIV